MQAEHGNIFGRFVSARYLLALLGSCGMAIVYGLKVNLSVAIVSMVNHTAITLSNNLERKAESCPVKTINITEELEDGPFTWPGTLQGTMLSSYFWGYLIAQIPGGRIAEVFSAKWLMFFAVAVNVLCTILTPLAAKIHYGLMLLMRICEGIGGGVTFPAMHVMLAHWAPVQERTIMSSIVYAGTTLGTVVSMLAAGEIAVTLGWESVFYIMGSISACWLVMWAILIADTPRKQLFIDEVERQYIVESLGTNIENRHRAVPWKRIFTSPPFIAILISHTCNNWGWYMVLIVLPSFFKNVLHFTLRQNALITAAPFLFMWLFSMVLSRLLDSLRMKQIIDTTQARKLGTLISSFVPMVCFAFLGFIGCHRGAAVALMTFAVTSIGGMFCGFLTNHIDIAPNFAGTLIAITNTAATIPGILVPLFVGKLTQNDPSITSWRIVFAVTICLYLIEILVYSVYGSGEEQPWNKCDELIETERLKSVKSSLSESYESMHDEDTAVTVASTQQRDDDDDDEK